MSQIHILMRDSVPECAYADADLAQYDCDLCNQCAEGEEEPAFWWVKHINFIYEVTYDTQC